MSVGAAAQLVILSAKRRIYCPRRGEPSTQARAATKLTPRLARRSRLNTGEKILRWRSG